MQVIFDKLAETQSEFERQCSGNGKVYPYQNLPNFYIELSNCPRKIGHSIHPKGEFGTMVVSHSLKLTGFQKTLNWAIKNCLLG